MLGKYKIRVNNKAESKEAQELLFELGYYWAYRSIGKKFFYEESDVFLFANVDGVIGAEGIGNADFFNSNSAKEITLPQLRDLVTQSKKEQGLISGADALRALVDGKEVEYFTDKWVCCDSKQLVVSWYLDDVYQFRLKPSTVKIEIEIPAPFEPEDDDEVYFIDCDTKRGYSSDVIGQGCCPEWIQFGAWKSEDEIKQVVSALRSALASK